MQCRQHAIGGGRAGPPGRLRKAADLWRLLQSAVQAPPPATCASTMLASATTLGRWLDVPPPLALQRWALRRGSAFSLCFALVCARLHHAYMHYCHAQQVLL